MSKCKPDKDIAETYSQYRRHMDSDKGVKSPFIVSDPKHNHPDSYAGEIDVSSSYPYGNTSANCEIKRFSEFHYTFSYISDALQSKIMARLDAGKGTHKNTAPDIPLALTSVQTPHFHEYREDGYLIAYPIEGIDYSSEASTHFGLSDGFSYFCKKLRIQSDNSSLPLFEFQPFGRLPFTDKETDPNINVDFTEID